MKPQATGLGLHSFPIVGRESALRCVIDDAAAFTRRCAPDERLHAVPAPDQPDPVDHRWSRCAAVRWPASGEARYVTGIALPVDAGFGVR